MPEKKKRARKKGTVITAGKEMSAYNGLVKIGFTKKQSSELIKKKEFRKKFMNSKSYIEEEWIPKKVERQIQDLVNLYGQSKSKEVKRNIRRKIMEATLKHPQFLETKLEKHIEQLKIFSKIYGRDKLYSVKLKILERPRILNLNHVPKIRMITTLLRLYGIKNPEVYAKTLVLEAPILLTYSRERYIELADAARETVKEFRGDREKKRAQAIKAILTYNAQSPKVKVNGKMIRESKARKLGVKNAESEFRKKARRKIESEKVLKVKKHYKRP